MISTASRAFFRLLLETFDMQVSPEDLLQVLVSSWPLLLLGALAIFNILGFMT